tara:strand:- start:613 stop:852 length:240 start_codon:yes stop_codon:yes gene_type:complete
MMTTQRVTLWEQVQYLNAGDEVGVMQNAGEWLYLQQYPLIIDPILPLLTLFAVSITTTVDNIWSYIVGDQGYLQQGERE